jgi:hypothetical protein
LTDAFLVCVCVCVVKTTGSAVMVEAIALVDAFLVCVCVCVVKTTGSAVMSGGGILDGCLLGVCVRVRG